MKTLASLISFPALPFYSNSAIELLIILPVINMRYIFQQYLIKSRGYKEIPVEFFHCVFLGKENDSIKFQPYSLGLRLNMHHHHIAYETKVLRKYSKGNFRN